MTTPSGSSGLTGEVEDQAAATRDVQQLEAATDAEDGDVAVERGADGVELGAIALRVDVVRERVRIAFAVARRRDVATAGKAEPVEVRRRVLAGLDDDHVRARVAQRVDVEATRAKHPLVRGMADGEHDARTPIHRIHRIGSRRLARSMSSMSTPPEARGCRNATMPWAPRRGRSSMSSTPSAASVRRVAARSSTT